ncbi:hypothetical protein [Sulfolobus sp. B1]|uniref:hypothetical protein n=1 Tax=Sulfolobus sp. B1 TaxID=2200888 RepID=UPI0021035959|nr:hypothetical protein [Sulfolobus sp. B1]
MKILPLYGRFYDAKEKKSYKAEELRGYNVYLNLKENAEWVKKGVVVLWGFSDSDFVQVGFESGESSKA